MTEVTFNYMVLVSAEEIRGCVVNARSMQNEHSPFFLEFSNGEPTMGLHCAVRGEFLHTLCLCYVPSVALFVLVCTDALCAIVCMFAIPVYIQYQLQNALCISRLCM